LPATDVVDAIAQLKMAVPRLLGELRLTHGEVIVTATPRRLVALVKELAPRQTDEETLVKGPPADRAFDASGAATPAAVGFARKYGVPVEALEIRQEGAARYVHAAVRKTGRPTTEALAEALPGLIAGVRFGKTMRWNSTNVAFSRPVRWLVSLLGETVVPFAYADLTAGRITRGPRAEGSPELEVASAEAYLPLMALHNIIVDRAARQAAIKAQVAALAAEVGGVTPDDPGLLDEVTDLVEQPTAIRGSFDETYLRLPKEVLITVMKKHQRYFPVVGRQVDKETSRQVDKETSRQVDKTGKPLVYLSTCLLPYFITVRNGSAEFGEVVRAGNDGVIRARYADANYFFKADTARKLADFTPRLATLTFQEKLGSMLDKVHRLEKLAPAIGCLLGLDDADLTTAGRAAALAKSDLATQMVVELTSLQGIMGREYARLSGEPDAVAVAIFEHYLPRSQGDALPQTRPSLALGIASRLDSLVGLFAVGLAPTASADPFGLRRDALGLVQTLAGAGQTFDLRPALAAAAGLMPVPVSEQVLADVLAFIRDRLYGWLRDQGLPHDVVSAVLAEQGHDPARAAATARDLAELVKLPDWADLFTAYARCKRIVRALPEVYPLAPERYTEPATSGLYEAWRYASRTTHHAERDIAILSAELRALKEPINRFFTDVLVMAEEPAVRQARLALVQQIAALPAGIADLSQLQGF
jgi:glycyl-tRNA synthetase